MVTVEREELKKDPLFRKIWQWVKTSHKVAKHTVDVLVKNSHIKDFCEEAFFFAQFGETNPVFIGYKVSSWLKSGFIITRIDAITFYDNKIEYEIARAKGIHSQNDGDFAERN